MSLRKQTPSDFLKQIIGRPVVVKLNSGVDYRGELAASPGQRCSGSCTARPGRRAGTARGGSSSGESGGEEGNGGFTDQKYSSKSLQPLAAAVDCSLKTSLSF